MNLFRIMGKSEVEVSELLALGGSRMSPRQHLEGCMKAGILCFVFTWLAWILFSSSAFLGIVVSLLAAASATIYFFRAPEREIKVRAKRIEKHLPFALMQLSVDLNTKIPMDKALEKVCEGDYGELSQVLGKEISKTKSRGVSFPQAIRNACFASCSKQFSRTMLHIISIYENGTIQKPGEIARQMALEGLAAQKAESKEFAAKASVLAVAFIALSAVLPSLFQSFVIVGGSFMEIGFDSMQVLLIVAVLFPALDIAALFYIKSIIPESMK